MSQLKLEHEIQLAAQKFSVLDYGPVGFCLLRQDLTVLFWNRCLENWSKINRGDVVGTSLGDRFPELYQPKYQSRLRHVFERGFPAIFSPQLHKPLIPCPISQGFRIQQTTVTAVPSSLSQESFYALLAIQDVTELTQRIRSFQKELQERQRAEAELQRSNAELEQFAYLASHDLREPLRMVTSFTQLLSQRYKGQLDAEADKIIGFAVNGACRMESLINDLLAYSRVGRRGNPFTTTNLNEIVVAALTNLKVLIEENDAVICLNPLPTIAVDQAQILQVFQNLVANAIKYRGEHSPMVTIDANRLDNHWQFSVQDNGIGIDQRHFDRIFLLFQRLHTRDQYSGTGIGLAICKKIVERHGGNIWLESALGQGSTFYFTLRLDHVVPVDVLEIER